jgi:NAD(P)-dependent dehydrogenase (short-subunit alcohol dehydrogenase family)
MTVAYKRTFALGVCIATAFVLTAYQTAGPKAAIGGLGGAAAQLEQTANLLPVQRVGTTADVAKAVAFLIDNSFVNGTTVVVDGGHRLV